MINTVLEIVNNLSSLAKTREGNYSIRELNKMLKACNRDKQHDNKNTTKVLKILDDSVVLANETITCPCSKQDIIKLINNAKDLLRDNLEK
jgi:hypothetical protein